MIRVAIVEDDPNYRKMLQKYMERFERENGEKILVECFDDGADITEAYPDNLDLILMDIEMKFLDGMTTAEKIRAFDEEVIIIFITNTPQYAMQGYAVDALDYVLKPVNYFAFSQRLERAISRMQKREKNYITLNYRSGIKKLDVNDIYYVEVRDHDLIYHTKGEEITLRGTMKEVEIKFEKNHFFRCSKGYLVNLEYVESFQDNNIQVGGDLIPVSRAKKKEFLDTLNNYMNEVSK